MAKSAPYVSDSCAGIIKGLKALGSRHSLWSAFEDWLKVCAISISNSVDWNHWEEREQQYLETINKYTPDEQKILVETFSELVVALEREHNKGGPTDLLGKVFHTLELHNKYHGQFFTPFHLCEFMGQISLGDGGEAGTRINDALTEKGFVSVCEPAVGSGGMVIGLANAMYRNKLNYCKQMVAYCCDIDIKCVYMTYLQLSLYGIPAVVVHGNSLTEEQWSVWKTPVYILDFWEYKIKHRENNKLNQTEVEKIKKETVTEDNSETNNVPPKFDIEYSVNRNGQMSLF